MSVRLERCPALDALGVVVPAAIPLRLVVLALAGLPAESGGGTSMVLKLDAADDAGIPPRPCFAGCLDGCARLDPTFLGPHVFGGVKRRVLFASDGLKIRRIVVRLVVVDVMNEVARGDASMGGDVDGAVQQSSPVAVAEIAILAPSPDDPIPFDAVHVRSISVSWSIPSGCQPPSVRTG